MGQRGTGGVIFMKKTTDQIQEFLRKTGNYVSVYGFDSFFAHGNADL